MSNPLAGVVSVKSLEQTVKVAVLHYFKGRALPVTVDATEVTSHLIDRFASRKLAALRERGWNGSKDEFDRWSNALDHIHHEVKAELRRLGVEPE